MKLLSNLSIKHKITSIVMVVTLIVLLISSAEFVATEYVSFRRSTIESMSILAEVAATNTAAALLFNDQATANEVLSALRAQPTILAAFILDRQGRVFANYFRNPLSGYSPSPATDVRTIISGMSHSEDRYEFEGKFLNYYRPILNLAETMKVVSNEKKYSIREERQTSKEIGILIDGFNEMLSKIEKRDIELEINKEHLEEQVGERTRELSAINDYLKAVINVLNGAKESA